jgi:glycosyltransferase involved in cell wall biosynthesis
MDSGRRARVLFINDTARNGGPGRSLHSILKFLDPAAVYRCVVLPRPGPIADLLAGDRVVDEMRFETGLIENPIEPWSRPMQRGDYGAPPLTQVARAVGNAGRLGGALARLARTVRRERFDLVYCNGTNADFAGAVVAAMSQIPALWHVRYSWLPPVARRPHRLLSASRAVRRILCVSGAAAGLFRHCADKVRVLHNALDVDAFDPERVRGSLRAELSLSQDAVVIGSHGRVLRRKGYLEMIAAARRVLESLDGPVRDRLHFVVVGDTPDDFVDDHLAECRGAAARAGLAGCFHLLGFRADVRPLVADFDVAVVPSIYADPLPRAVIEAMALAKPVVAFGVGGVAEMMLDGVTGELVPLTTSSKGGGATARSIDLLARSIAGYAVDPDRRRRHGQAGRARILASFDARAHARVVEHEIRATCAVRR